MDPKPLHKVTFKDLGISPYQASLVRICEVCQTSYTIDSFSPREWTGAVASLRFLERCEQWCLPCWLGVGPTDFPEDYLEAEETPKDDATAELLDSARTTINALQIGPFWQEWQEWRNQVENGIYEAQCAGDIQKAYSFFTDRQIPLVVMPLTRATSDRSIHFPNAITYYPPGMANLKFLDELEVASSHSNASMAFSAAAGASLENLKEHGLLVFPAQFDAGLVAETDHNTHLELIRRLSEEVDKVCLNFVRYYTCTLDRAHTIPSRAGQTKTDPAMSLCLVYVPAKRDFRIYGGAAFAFAFTGGTGIWLRQPEWPTFPGEGEVGKIVYHALTLYATILEASSETLRFIQSLSLLEFLAFPRDYEKFEKVKKVIARYVAEDQSTYNSLLERFRELTGKVDPTTRAETGLRTRVIHIGDRIESLVPLPEGRRALFAELDGYIRPVINHMIDHSEASFDEYVEIRKTFPAFLVGDQTL